MIANKPNPTLPYLLLGLLHQKPESRYGLRKILSESLIGVYSDSPGSVYPAVKRLVEEGWVEPEPDQPAGGRERVLYRPTAAGREAFREWLLHKPTREDIERRMELLVLRLAFMDGRIPAKEQRRFLALIVEHTSGFLAGIRKVAKEQRDTMPRSGYLALRQGLKSVEANLKWAQESLVALEKSP